MLKCEWNSCLWWCSGIAVTASGLQQPGLSRYGLSVCKGPSLLLFHSSGVLCDNCVCVCWKPPPALCITFIWDVVILCQTSLNFRKRAEKEKEKEGKKERRKKGRQLLAVILKCVLAPQYVMMVLELRWVSLMECEESIKWTPRYEKFIDVMSSHRSCISHVYLDSKPITRAKCWGVVYISFGTVLLMVQLPDGSWFLPCQLREWAGRTRVCRHPSV